MRFTAVLLAGGRSARMGRDKAAVLLAGKPLVEHVLDALEPVTRSVVIVANDAERFGDYEGRARIVRDDPPHAGPLAALRIGLQHSREDWCFATGCDAPFLQPAFVQKLATFSRGHDAVLPGNEQERWPLTAFYAKRCLPAMERAVQRGDMKLISFHPEVAVRWVPKEELRVADPDLRSLWNLNTPDDVGRAEALLSGARPG